MSTGPAPAGLVPRLSFGLAGKIRESLSYSEDGSYVYPSGHNVVFLAPDGRSQRFVPGTPDCEGVTAIALSPNRKLLAVAERAEKAIISIYDTQTLKRRKVLQATEVGSKEYVSLSFSSDGKLLLAQGGRPDWNLLLWSWEKSKVASSTRATNTPGNPIVKASLSHGDNQMVTVVGAGVLRMFKVAEGALKPLPLAANKRDTLTFTCHNWVPPEKEGSTGDKDQRQLMGTADGEILLFEGPEPKATFTVEPGLSVESLAVYSKGFVVGHSNGSVTLFERDDREYYRRARTFGVHDHNDRILSLAVNLNEEQLVLALESGSAWTLALSATELMKPEDHNFELLGGGGHSAAVTGLDMCVRRPLIATCSSDRSVRLWNYLERGCELAKTFQEEAHSIAIHPMGLMILVGFADKLRLMSVLMDDFKVLKELPIKSCRDVAFSNGGHLFAAVNGLTVSLYNTYTCENLGNLRGHNGKVRSIGWSADDTRLVSAGMDGAVYEWRLSDLKRDKESVLKGCQYNAALMTPDAKTLVGAGSDHKIREVEDCAGTGATVVRDVDLGPGAMVTAMALPYGGKVLFAGLDTGTIRAYRMPLTGEFYEVKAAEGPLTRLRVSYDDCLLAATGEDGSLLLLDIRDKELIKASSRREQERLAWLEEVLVGKAELEERKSRTNELEQAVAELTMQTEYQLRLKDLHVQEKLKELSERAAVEVDAERAKLEALTREKLEAEVEAEEKLKAMEARSASQLAALDAQYQSRMMAEVERYQQLLQEKEALNERWDEQNSLLVESHERVIAELTEEYEAKLAEEALKLEGLRSDKGALEKEAAEVKKQQEEDADREIEELKDKYEARLTAEREGALRLKGEAGILRKKFQGLQKDLEEQREALATQHEQQKDLYATIKGLEKDIASLKREIRERDDTIGDKERRIYELKKKNQELEKFKFVLDYKIKELKKQIEPREVEIAAMKETVRAMDAELERYHKSNATLDLTISNLKLKEAGLQGEVGVQRTTKAAVAESHKRLLAEVAGLAGHIQDPKGLKEQVKQLYQRHCQGSGPASAVDEEVNQEYARQRQYLERTVEGLKRKLAVDVETHRVEGLKVMQQNVALIKEINELRREIKNLKTGTLPRSTTAAGGTLTGYLTGSLRSSKGTTATSTMGASGVFKSQASPRAPALTSSMSKGRDTGVMSAGQQQQMAKLQQQQAAALAEAEAEQQGLRRELDMQRDLIERLRADLEAKGEAIAALESGAGPADVRGGSRERLPGLDHPSVLGLGTSATVTAPLDEYDTDGAAPMRSGSSSGRPGTANPSSRRGSAGAARGPSAGGSRAGSAGGAAAAAAAAAAEAIAEGVEAQGSGWADGDTTGAAAEAEDGLAAVASSASLQAPAAMEVS